MRFIFSFILLVCLIVIVATFFNKTLRRTGRAVKKFIRKSFEGEKENG